MTAAIVTIRDYAVGDIVSRTDLLNALKTALIVSGWTILNDTANVSGIPTVELQRNQGSGKTKSTIYLRIITRPTDFGYVFGHFTSDTPNFASISSEYGSMEWVDIPANFSYKFVSVSHPEAQTVHMYASGTSTLRGYLGVIRPLQKPSYINEDIFTYAIHLFGVGVNCNFRIWSNNVPEKNPYFPQDQIQGLFGTQRPQNETTFNPLIIAREIFPSVVFRTTSGWYGTTSADIVKAGYELPGDKLILPSGAQYATCVPWGGAAIRI